MRNSWKHNKNNEHNNNNISLQITKAIIFCPLFIYCTHFYTVIQLFIKNSIAIIVFKWKHLFECIDSTNAKLSNISIDLFAIDSFFTHKPNDRIMLLRRFFNPTITILTNNNNKMLWSMQNITDIDIEFII